MVGNCFQLEIVSAEEEIFSGEATKLFVTGSHGEMEILYGHAPLLTSLHPGPVWLTDKEGKEEAYVIFGGMLEVQPQISIVVADSALRAKDIDEIAAKEAKREVEQRIAHSAKVDYAKARAELAFAVAQLRVLRTLRKKL